MIRHLFIGTFKKEISLETREKEISDMAAMKEKIPEIFELKVGMSTGWVGESDQVVMTVDFTKKEDFDVYMSHPYHIGYIEKNSGMYFDTSSFVAAQFQFDSDEKENENG